MRLEAITARLLPRTIFQPRELGRVANTFDDRARQPGGARRIARREPAVYSVAQPFRNSADRERRSREPMRSGLRTYQAERFRPGARYNEEVGVVHELAEAGRIQPPGE